MTVSGPSTWTGGTMTGTGTAVFNGALVISGNTFRNLTSGRTLTTNGTTTWTNASGGNAGLIQVSNGVTINNAGTWLDQQAFDNSIQNAGGTTSNFNNTGTYTKSGNTTTTINLAFNNTASGPGTGIVNVNAGTLVLSGGGTSNGKFDVASGAVLNFGGGTHNLSGTVAGAGTGQMQVSGGTVNTSGSNAFGGQLTVNGGVLNVGGTFDALAVNLTSGSIGGAGTLTASGPSTWTGGTMTGTGTTVFNGALAISGNTFRNLISGRTLTTNGTTTWTNASGGNAGLIQVSNGVTINNAGTWLDQQAFDNSIQNAGGTTSNFNNTGTYTKSGSNTTTIGAAFNNTGFLDVQAGRLVLNDVGGLQGNGALRVGAAGAVTASSGNDTVSTFTHQGGAGSFDIGTHTLTVSADYNNANFGMGNAFNRRANVTTTGTGNRIIAFGDVNQGVSGVGVANGTSITPTLTLGNVHVGGATITYNIANTGTTGPALRGAIQTSVNGANLTDVRLSGSGVTAGNWGLIAAGANLSRDVTLTIGTAGVYAPLSGQSVNILNNFDNTRSQLVTINSSAGAAAYNLASANAISPVNFGVVHVGDTVTQALTISNTASAGAFSEKLNASFGGTSDARILTSGSIGLLAAGSTNNTSMLVGLNTAAAGVVSGTATVLLQSDGTGTSGLGITGLPSQLVGVSGDIQTIGQVFRLAQPSFHTPEPVSFGNVRVGTATNQNLSLTNLAANDGFSEKLNASIGGATAGVTAGGAFNLLAAQATNSSSLHVGIDTTTAGAKAGTATITLVSDGTGTSGLGQTALPSQTVNVSGNVYRLANPTLVTNAVSLAARVGDVAPTRNITITNTSPDMFTERLNASIGAGPAGFTTSGSVTGLAAGASNNAFAVSLNTASAASLSGTAAIAFVSSGAGTTNAADASVGSQNVSLMGHVYAPAVAQLNTTVVDFGIVHRGDVLAARNVSVTNSATSAALNDTLNATLSGGAAPFATGGTAAGIVVGGTSGSALNATLNTANTGSFASNATVTFVSHDAELADLALASAAVALKGQVNDFAKVGLAKSSGSGTFSGGSTSFMLDFGNLLLGSGSLSSSLTLSTRSRV